MKRIYKSTSTSLRKSIGRHGCVSILALAGTCPAVSADDYALSPDGSAVLRLDATTSVSAASFFDSGLLPDGWAAVAGSDGSLVQDAYSAGFDPNFVGNVYGATYEATYTNNTQLQNGQCLEWIQVVSSNDPAGAPFLDNQKINQYQGLPFYDYTQSDNPTTYGTTATSLFFGDHSARLPSGLAFINPITWNASLYPVIWNKGKIVTVENGVNWGWTMKPATVGTISAVFDEPSPSDAVVTGVGTSNFGTGTGEQSTLSFRGGAFDTLPGTSFKLGTLTYHNGSNTLGTAASEVVYDATVDFDNIPEKDFVFSTDFSITNTPNTDDPIASADYVQLGSFPEYFNVLEGDTASVDIYATLTTDLDISTPGYSGTANADESPNYVLNVVGLEDPTPGGFITPVPETATMPIAAACFCSILTRRWNHSRSV